MRLSLGQSFKCVQIVLLYKLGVLYSRPISIDVSVPSARKITLVDLYLKCRYKDFLLLVGKIEPNIQAVWM